LALPGDINGDGQVDTRDVDNLVAAIRAGHGPEAELNGDGVLDRSDLQYLIQSLLNTRAGDTNLDRRVDFRDFVALAGSFQASPAGWSQGNFDLDGAVTFDDFVQLAGNFGFAGDAPLAEATSRSGSAPAAPAAAGPVTSGPSTALRISEVHYHPAQATPAEVAAGLTDEEEFEFLELVNLGAEPLDLTSARLVRIDVQGELEGVAFDFAAGAITALPPGERLLVVEDLEAFAFRYGTHLPVAGQWQGKLGNGGEQITLQVGGQIVQQFTYDDAWHPSTDGEGYSLEAVAPASQDPISWNTAAAWRPSLTIGGSPGAPGLPPVRGDFDGDQTVTARDIDLLMAQVRSADPRATFDLTGDGLVDSADLTELITRILGTRAGDTDLDGTVAFPDFVALSAAYGVSKASWSQGNFDADDDVDFADFVLLAGNFSWRRQALD
jgi:hypothetical protein